MKIKSAPLFPLERLASLGALLALAAWPLAGVPATVENESQAVALEPENLSIGAPLVLVPGTPPPDSMVCDDVLFDTLPSDYTAGALGNAAQVAAASVNGRLHLSGTGSELYHGQDNAGFFWREVSGDFRLQIDIESLPVQSAAGNRKIGLMLRDSTHAQSARVMIEYMPGFPNGPALQFDVRTQQGAAPVEMASSQVNVQLPATVALVRRANRVTVLYSADGGANWLQPLGGIKQGSSELVMTDPLLVGANVTSYDQSNPITGAFDDLRLCRPAPVPAPPVQPCEQKPLDLMLLVDVSGSMKRQHGPLAGNSRLDTVRDGLLQVVQALEARGDGSRAAMIVYSGTGVPANNLANGARVRTAFSAGLPAVRTAIQQLDDGAISETASSPAAIALDKVLEVLNQQRDPNHRAVVLWATDNLSNVDRAGHGASRYTDAELQQISIADGAGGFLGAEQVLYQGTFNSTIFTYDGQPVADGMHAVGRILAAHPLPIFSLVPRGDGSAALPILREDLVQWAAWYSGGTVFGSSDRQGLLDLVAPMLASLSCPDEEPPVPPAVGIDTPALGAACLPAGAPFAAGGFFAVAAPSSGQNGAPSPLVLTVTPTGGPPASYAGTLSADGGRWSVAGLAPGSGDGQVLLAATATDATGASATAVKTLRVDAQAPTVQITEGGAPFAGAAAGETPPAGAQPVLLGRRVAFGAIVTDGPAGAPPAAVFTLDGQPYASGTPIEAEGTHLLVARATDCAGRITSAHAHFRLDLGPPRLLSTSPADGATLAALPAGYSGNSDPDLATAAVNGRPATVTGGNFSLASHPWQEGLNRVEIELVDAAGHRATFERSFTVSSAPLAVSIVESGLPISPNQLFTRPISPRAIASTSEATVTLSLNGAPFAAGGSIGQSGEYTLAATATHGGRNAAASVSFSLDLTPAPTLRITEPEEAADLTGATVTVRGTVTGDGVTVAVDGLPATVAGGGFELEGYPLPQQEVVTISAVATDRLGRQASSQVTVLHRSIGPWVLILDPAEGAVTSREVVDVAGAVAEGPGELQAPNVLLRGGAGGDLNLPLLADGSFRARDVPLAPGANLLTAEAVDRFGRTGSASVTIFRDSQPPAIEVAANGQPLGEGAIFSSQVALAVTFADSGTLAERSVRLNGQLQSLQEDGSFARTLEDEGGYLLSVLARDGAGNESRAERSFLIDGSGCGLAEIFPADGATVETAAVTLTGRAGAAAAKLKVRLAGGGPEHDGQLADGTFLVAGLALPNMGDNLLELICTDAAGRTLPPEKHKLRRVAAGQGPTIEILSPTDDAMLGVERVAVSGTLSGGEASVNGVAASVAGSSPKTFALASLTLAEGPNVIAARAADAGRIGSDRIVVWRDTQAPKIVITSPDSGARLGIAGGGPARVDVSGRVELTDEPRLPIVKVRSPAGEVTATLDPATGVFLALAVPLAENLAADQAQTLTATATDSLDHRGTATAEVFLDTTGPAIVLAQPADLGRYHESSPPQIAVQGEVWAAAGATVSVNGATLAEAAISWGAPGPLGRRHGQFSAQVALPSRDGAFGIIARVVGADQRYAEARRLLLKDSAAPSVVEIQPAGGSAGVDPSAMVLVLFSEPIDPSGLAGAGGLELFRQSSGQAQAAQFAFAGNAVAVVPSAALAAGESYRLSAGTAIRDLAGHPLAAASEAVFTVASSPLAAAPVLDALPAVLCAAELLVTGQATAGAEVKVKDGNLLFSGNADATGRFSVRLPLASSGWHYLSVYAVDPASGVSGPAAGHGLRVDCSAPTVKDARLDRQTGVLSLLFSEAMDDASFDSGSAAAAIRLRDAEDPGSPYYSATVLEDSGNYFELQLDPAPEAWWRDRPVRLAVGAPAADVRGNPMAAIFEQVFFPGGGGLSGGFLYGEAWDDNQGRPLAGATASLFAAGASTPLHSVQADGRGRYTFAGEVAAGRYALLIEKSGYTPVVRWLALEPAKGAVAFDARLTLRGPARGTLDPAAGGRTPESDGLAFEASATGLPGSAPLEVSLTALSGQGLPDFLPLGYTPAAAAELHLSAGGTALAESVAFPVGEVRVELPLRSWVESGDVLVAAQYQMATGRWLALAEPEPLGNGRVALAPLGPGVVAILVPDQAAAFAPPPAVVNSALEGAAPPEEIPAFAAALSLDPRVVAPTGRSLARVVARSQDLVSAWPSGLAVQAFLEEKLILAAGQGQLLEAPFVADLLLYHPRLTAAERNGAAEGAAGALTFVVSPSPRAAQVLLDVGFEKIRLYPFPEKTERGQVVGPAGGTVGDPAAAELSLPEGALSGSTVAEVELLSAAELEDLPAVGGFRTLAAVRLGFSGKELARPATLRLLRPAATADEVAGDPRLILGELTEYPEDQRGAFVHLAARVLRQGSGPGERLVAGPEAEGSLLALDGIVREGNYLLLEAENPIGFATGLVRGAGSTLLQHARVTASPLGTADLSRLTGRYALPVPAGAARPLEGRHPQTDELAVAAVTVAAGQVVGADLELIAVAPTIVALQPNDGAENQPAGTTVRIVFSEAIDPGSAGSGSLRLEMAGPGGAGSGVYASGRVSVLGSDLIFESAQPLPPGRSWIARFDGGVRDLQGNFYGGAAPLEWRFTTSNLMPPGGQVDPTKFHVELPVNGVIRIWGEPGALPLTQSGQAPWVASPYLVGPFVGRDPSLPTLQAQPDGGFEGTVGRAGYAATIASRVWVKILDPTRQLAAEFEVGPLRSADGKAFVAQPGEAISFRTAEGLVVDVPAAAFDQPTLVRISAKPASSIAVPTPAGLAVGGVFELDFEGEAKETLRLYLPAPAGAPAGADVFFARVRQMPWGPRLQLMSYGGVGERGGELFLSNDADLQPEPAALAEPDPEGFRLKDAEPGSDGDHGPWGPPNPPQTCGDVQRRGLGQCFSKALLYEFTVRQLAVAYYDLSAHWTLAAGGVAPLVAGWGQMAEALVNKIADLFVFLPKPIDSTPGLWVLPVTSDEPLVIQRRDLATGWVLDEKAYDPIGGQFGGMVVLEPFASDDTGRPMLVDASPFHLLRFPPPEPGRADRLRLDLQVATRGDGISQLEGVENFPLADFTSLQSFDLSLLSPEPVLAQGQEAAIPRVIAGESLEVCGGGDWQLELPTGSDDLLVVAGAGDRIVAFDTNAMNEEQRFRPVAAMDGFANNVRTFATDGHNRLFYTSLFGTTWAVKAIRIEDALAATTADCGDPQAALACFQTTLGSVRVARLSTSTGLPSQYVLSGALSAGIPSDFEILTQDEHGQELELSEFFEAYADIPFTALDPDAEGIYTFDVPLRSTYARGEAGQEEPSLPGVPTARLRQREATCTAEETYDRFQRVTVDNLTTGQSWGLDLENHWPKEVGNGADGRGRLEGIKARRGDLLKVRYNLQALGYLSINGSGLAVIDVNRFYRLAQPSQTAGNGQCGRYLGRFEGASIQFPPCAYRGSGPEGLAYTPALEVVGETGCEDGPCRGTGNIDVYSPLLWVGGVHNRAAQERPGYLTHGELAACINEVAGKYAFPVDMAVAKDVEWLDNGFRGNLSGVFFKPNPRAEPRLRRGDLLFFAVGSGGVLVFDVSNRKLAEENLIGLLQVDDRTALRLQYDPRHQMLLVGGTDSSSPAGSKPVIDFWPIRNVNGGPPMEPAPRPRLSIEAAWTTDNLALDQVGTGLLYTWDPEKGLAALPYDHPQFQFSGLYLAGSEEEEAPTPDPERVESAIQRITSTFVPLGVPLRDEFAGDGVPDAETRRRNERDGTAAFKLRVALPGILGEEITAKVQSLRTLPDERLLGRPEIGPALALPGGPGWPEPEVLVRLRRIGVGPEESSASPLEQNGPGGRFDTVYNLYESVETVVLIADPRAGKGYRLQDLPDSQLDERANRADERAQCRNCQWPSYLRDPHSAGQNHPDLENVRELLAGGRYLRAILAVDPSSPTSVKQHTQAAIEFFSERQESYPPPSGWAKVAAPADFVPSPIQASLAEPPLGTALWTPSEAGVSVALTSGDLILTATDHHTSGRGRSFSLDRTYRSGGLGYGPFGSAGWSSPLFAHLREIETTGEVELHDGNGVVYRFALRGREEDPSGEPAAAEPPPGYEEDELASYYPPEGIYLRLVKLATGGWRLLGRQNDSLLFDGQGRLTELSDRLRQAKGADEQGNSMRFFYDAFGQLARIEDDLARSFRFEYFEDHEAEPERYGLLRKLTDFAGRTVEYGYSDERTLTEVRLPDVENGNSAYAQFSYVGENRPKVEYRYAPQRNVTADPEAFRALLHGEFAQLRLASLLLPAADPFAARVPRVRFEYGNATGRLEKIVYPDAEGRNDEAGGVAYQVEAVAVEPSSEPAERVKIYYPWGHQLDYEIAEGRIVTTREDLEVSLPSGTVVEPSITRYTYSADGRTEKVVFPNGATQTLCYPDSTQTGCPASLPANGGGKPDRMARLNAIRSSHVVEPEDAGLAEYLSIDSETHFGPDNQVKSFLNGNGEAIELPASYADQEAMLNFESDGVVVRTKYDAFGRLTERRGDGGGEFERFSFGKDAKGRDHRGLVKRWEKGSLAAATEWEEVEYDAASNVTRRAKSNGEVSRFEYDAWDRATSTHTGLTDGRLRPLGVATCDEGEGAQEERAWDAAGHLVRLRHLQDFVDAEGNDRCRWVETRYHYNNREQVVAIEESHLSDPLEPGEVLTASREVMRLEYDAFGRVAREIYQNLAHAPVVTHYRYDLSGRKVGTRIGTAAEAVVGFDLASRVVFESDGDQSVWRGRYDAWNRLWEETLPTGAVVRRKFDPTGNLTEFQIWDRDPASVNSGAQLLQLSRAEYTSYGETERLVEVLGHDTEGEELLRIVETEFDASGRVVSVVSGPNLPSTAELDRDLARRETSLSYEIDGGRLLLRSAGGSADGSPLHQQRYHYEVENRASWPDRIDLLESVPGSPDFVETSSALLRRDALGRVVEEIRSGGERLETIYDRSGQAIRFRDAAGTQTALSRDGRGRLLQEFRPDGRGSTRYAYDLDGRRVISQTATEAGPPWQQSFGYDALGRLDRIDHQDGSFEASTYNPDGTVATSRTRDGVVMSYTYDAANRVTTVVPSAEGALDASLAPLDAGSEIDYDSLSRALTRRTGRAGLAGFDPAATVSFGGFDLGNRPSGETVGGRGPLAWRWDVWNRAIEVELPTGPGRAGTGFRGFSQSFDSLGRMTAIGGLGSLTPSALGADFAWGGSGRFYGMTTRAAAGTALRLGYWGGSGPQLAGATGGQVSAWQLGTISWGGGGSAQAPTALPEEVWGQFGFGWRGYEGDPQDGVKLGRLAVAPDSGGGLDLFGGMGWSWSYDAGVRMSSAFAGRGSLDGQPGERENEEYRYRYGKGDELERIVRQASGEVAEFEIGDQGRLLARGAVPFAYDRSGRRKDDDRFAYRWDWRGQLVSVTVKDTWPSGVSPFAGEQIRYGYDANGRLLYREHAGKLPVGESGDAARPFIERRAYVWDQDTLVAEAAYGDSAETQLRWRKTYVPGPMGLDDAIQVAVEAPSLPGGRLYTYLRDEQGTVIGLVAEDETTDPAQPAVAARYLYSPYGEAFAEVGPELRVASFDNLLASAGGVAQEVTDPVGRAAGGLEILFGSTPKPQTLAGAVTVEAKAGGVWTAVAGGELGIGVAPEDPSKVRVILAQGWLRGVAYRVKLSTALVDTLGRPLARAEEIEWTVAAIAATAFEDRRPIVYESFEAAADSLGGRLPGGQTSLFQGLWTDPVTGIAYARARWYDARNASWLSEDPYRAVDSPNLYAFVGWQPNMAVDPLGLAGEEDPLVVAVGKEIANESEKYADEKVSFWKELVTDPIGTAKKTLDGAIDFGFDFLEHGNEWPVQAFDAFVDGTERERVLMIARVGTRLALDRAVATKVAPRARQVAKAVGRRAAKTITAAVESAQDAVITYQASKLGDKVPGRNSTRDEWATYLSKAEGGPVCASSKKVGANCFVEGTLVATAEGQKPVETVEAGDLVWSVDEWTGELVLAQVTETFTRSVEEVWLVHLGGELVETTAEHPFYVDGKGYVEVKHLQPGDEIVSADGTVDRVESIEWQDRQAQVHNFEVAGHHNYFVSEGEYLVHNCGVRFWEDKYGQTGMVEGDIEGSHPGREKKPYRPDPSGTKVDGDHRGHLIPEAGVADKDLPDVNSRANLVWEAAKKNQGVKRRFERYAIWLADTNKGSQVVFVSIPHRTSRNARPYALTHVVLLNGKVMDKLTYLNQ